MFSYNLNSITFSDGTEVRLEPASVLLLVGPNSGGKSVALHDIEALVQNPDSKDCKAVTNVDDSPSVTWGPDELQELEDWLRKSFPSRDAHDHVTFFTYRTTSQFRKSPDGRLVHSGRIHGAFLCHRLQTEDRLQIARTTGSADLFNGQPEHYIHFLQENDNFHKEVSGTVRQAFEVGLIVNWRGGQRVWLHLGDDPPRDRENDRVSPRYAEELRKLPKLDEAGDGIRSFVGTLLAAKCGAHPVLLIDEPEAFLHPPQSRRLAAVLAQTAGDLNRQVIIATHSSDVLRGALTASKKVQICRIVRNGDVNQTSLLSKDDLQTIWSKPQLRSSTAIDGVFHEGAVICEADSDCRFYETLIREIEKDSKAPIDLYLTHGAGKGAFATLAKAYRSLSVKTAVISDLDLLRNQAEFDNTLRALGADPVGMGTLYKTVVSALNEQKPLISITDFAQRTRALVDGVEEKKKLDSRDRAEFEKLLSDAGDWSEAKRYGIGKLRGEKLSDAKNLLAKCQEVGLFLVPKGELEGWWPEGPPDKGKWIAKAIPRIQSEPTTFSEPRGFVERLCGYFGYPLQPSSSSSAEGKKET